MTRHTPASVLAFIVAASFTVAASAEVVTRNVEYTHDGQTYVGYLAYDDDLDGPLPAVVVIHEWWGLNDFAKEQTRMLAELGYVGFAADMFGDGQTTKDPQQAGQLAGAAKGKGLAMLAGLALEQVKQLEMVDADNVGAIGFCFGGTTVLEMARAGQELVGVVSFHGDLKPSADAAAAGRVKADVLVAHGATDPLVPPGDVAALTGEMIAAGVNLTLLVFPDTKHSFTNPEADTYGMEAAAYNETAAEAAFTAMEDFFADRFEE
ncbi:MAG: dienelactone hydrolase family protein [Phycisphaerae bacterium]